MPLEPQKQTDAAAFDRTVDQQLLTVEYWRERFKVAFVQYKDIADLADELADHDPMFKKAAGVLLCLRIQQKRGNLQQVARAVQLMEKLRPAAPDKSLKSTNERLKHQKLVAPR